MLCKLKSKWKDFESVIVILGQAYATGHFEILTNVFAFKLLTSADSRFYAKLIDV